MRDEYSKARVPAFWDGKAARKMFCQNQFVCEPIRSLLIVFGLSVVAVSIFADFIGVGHPGFGLKQSLGLVIGLLLSVAGLLKVHLTNTKILARGILGKKPKSSFHPFAPCVKNCIHI